MSEAGDVAGPSGAATGRKSERNERREQLYEVVRDAMTRAGVLTASYKFKVLSLDSRGANYLVMMDLSSQAADEIERLAEIEALIAQNAKSRHEILVSAVYWRLNEHVTAGLTVKRTTGGAAVPPVLTLTAVLVPGPAVALAAAPAEVRPSAASKSMDVKELLNFKNAFAATALSAPLAASGEILKSGRRNAQKQPAFANTELLDFEDRASPLGVTQYGDLS
jgi:hypothetical protein